MNIFNLNTKEKLDSYGREFLVVKEGISTSSITGFDRAVALLDFNANFRNKTLTLVVGIYELDEVGTPIISKSLKPYEETIVATNGVLVDENGLVVLEPEEDKVYFGEFDFYIYVTKNNSIKLWELFESIIKSSSKIN